MKIVMIGDEDGIAYPHFVCHVCGKPIVDVRFGLVVWFKQVMWRGELCDGFVVHKRECDKQLQAIHGSHLNEGQTTELSHFAQMTADHPSRQEHGGTPLKSFPAVTGPKI